jgi:membrane protein
VDTLHKEKANDARPTRIRGKQLGEPAVRNLGPWTEGHRLSIFNSIAEDRILVNTAAVTFYALLAVFPLMATLVSIYGYISDSRTIADQVTAMSGILPGGAVDVIRDELN